MPADPPHGSRLAPLRALPAPSSRLLAAALLAGVLLLAGPAAGEVITEEGNADPWTALAEVRAALEARGPVAARFSQGFLPAGFETGEQERGRVALDLPRCLRWDYDDPFPKSFLLCGLDLHSWIPGDPVGQLLALESAEEPGLDLLFLSPRRLRERYRAQAVAEDGGQVALELEPLDPADAAVVAAARLVLAPAQNAVVSLSYRDREGNTTTFSFGPLGDLPDDTLFAPPDGLRWESQ